MVELVETTESIKKDFSPMEAPEEVLRIENLRKWYPLKRGFLETVFSRGELNVKAVDGVSFTLNKGEIFALAGESGSGKTTLGKVLLRLVSPSSGSVFFQGKDITKLSDLELKPLRRKMQIVFQDPFESLNPRMIIKEIVAEPLRVQGELEVDEKGQTRHRGLGEAEVEERVKKILSEVEMVPPDEFMYRFPHELSGGQRQRVAVARAFVVDPEFVVADEPVSMLDVSIRAEVLNAMLELVQKRQVSFVYITHDLALAKHVCDRIAIMYLGKIVEMGPTEEVINKPLHPYTQALIAAIPVPDPNYRRGDLPISGEIPSPVNPPQACRFNTRCPYAFSECTQVEPPLVEVEPGHWAACHMVRKY